MNAKTKIQGAGMPYLAMSEQDLVDVLRTSLYPGASENSIKMVISYCKASNLDPMQKPVHIVPMWDSKAGSMRDVIMPGVGLYRTQAARSGALAGVSEPEFGSDKTEKIGGFEITYPEWCKVTVKRELPSGKIVEFTAVERWKENYAIKGGKEKSLAPNAMWAKRPYGQLAKCAQAQAFRVGFPEAGAAPTADEMEGNALEEYSGGATIDQATGEIKQLAEKPPCPTASLEIWIERIKAGKSNPDHATGMILSKYTLTDAQRAAINSAEPQTPDDGGLTDAEKQAAIEIEKSESRQPGEDE